MNFCLKGACFSKNISSISYKKERSIIIYFETSDIHNLEYVEITPEDLNNKKPLLPILIALEPNLNL